MAKELNISANTALTCVVCILLVTGRKLKTVAVTSLIVLVNTTSDFLFERKVVTSSFISSLIGWSQC